MSDVIKLLPDSVANQIAAGEVIQRPASVIKELVENAVDAGASDIRIYIKDAGRTLIQVVDNGKGMSPVDARMAFERHATSKIKRADDLFRLQTMGFRGEALPSICAISQVELKTRTKDSETGTLLLINGSKVEKQEPCVCETGTSISVKNLFFNVPARRKFLKSDNVELMNVMREFERLALVNNNIRMSIDTGSRHLDLRAASFHQRIHDLWKNNLKMQLLPVEVDTALVKIHGYVSRPEYARRRNALQFLIVNGRNMRHPYFHKAILSCFEGLIATDTQPCYFLKFDVDPATIDVNIHPTKNEIKFEYEQEIWPLLTAGVKASLGKNAAVPSIDFSVDAVAVDPLKGAPESLERESIAGYNPFNDRGGVDFIGGGGNFGGGDRGSYGSENPYASGAYASSRRNYENDSSLRNWDKLYAGFMSKAKDELEDISDAESEGRLPGMSDEELKIGGFCLQFADKYILASRREGLMIIDQHRAHVKVLYEQFLASARERQRVSQRVMFPESVVLTPEQQNALKEMEEELAGIGFELEYEEGEKWRINALPADLQRCDAKDVVLRILDSVTEDSPNYGLDQRPIASIQERMCLVMARSAAIKRGKRLTEVEMESLLGELFALPDPTYTPGGNKIYTTLDEQAIRRLLS